MIDWIMALLWLASLPGKAGFNGSSGKVWSLHAVCALTAAALGDDLAAAIEESASHVYGLAFACGVGTRRFTLLLLRNGHSWIFGRRCCRLISPTASCSSLPHEYMHLRMPSQA